MGLSHLKRQERGEQLQSLQPLTAAPDQHQLCFENRYVRVLEVIIPPEILSPFIFTTCQAFL